jgi:hypothetical protein
MDDCGQRETCVDAVYPMLGLKVALLLLLTPGLWLVMSEKEEEG